MTADDVTRPGQAQPYAQDRERRPRPQAGQPAPAGRCEWTGHGVSRREREDGQTVLTLEGHRYASRDEQAAGSGPVIQAQEPCATVITPTPPDSLVESPAAFDMVKEHCGEAYTVVWQGRGWTVEVSSGYPLWAVQG